MRKYPKIAYMMMLIFVLSMALLFFCLFTDVFPETDTVAGFSWLLMLVSAVCFVACVDQSIKNYSSRMADLNSRIESLTSTLMGAETALAENSGILKDYDDEVTHLTDINNSYKKQMALLRNELSASKTRLGECRQLMDELRTRAELGDNLKAAFVANIHDELRNPLNSILGYISLLSGSAISEAKRREYIEHISADANHFLDIVNDLFHYAKLVSGDVDVSVSTFNISQVINSAVSQARQWIEAKGKPIEVVVAIDPGIGFVRGFEAGFVRIISNLLSNAVKFTHHGRISVSCTVDRTSIYIAVEDTGIGFDADKRDLIFGGFYQVEYFLTRKYGGTGLGLSICRALARLMNGNITADSHKGSGSRFCLEVPLMEASEPELDIFARADRLLSSGGSLGRVMMLTPIAEDFDFVNGFFAHYGVSVMQSSSPDETEALLSEFDDISLVIIDLYSQSLEGVSAAEAIFRMRPNARFVFVSNGGLNPSQMDVVGMYSDYVLSKPLTSIQLGKVLEAFS